MTWTVVAVGDDDLPIRWSTGDNGLYMEFEIADWQHDDEPFSNPDDTTVTGSLNSDGCINWETNPDCMYHFFEPSDLDRLHRALRRIWTLGTAAMGDKYEEI